MNFLELVKNRYSCRAYKSLDVEKEKLDYILECVRFAPSAVKFALPENEEPAVIIPLGYAADEMKPKSRKVIDDIVK